ncbi:DUF4376 domain-containing protein [Thalassospira sp.]|uniref:DUF4376 domain-containing protein n=1 Tax=Thalassospira sp. TaxID=1912094 RepID=UPI003AA94ADA
MKWARISNGKVVELTADNPAGKYHRSIIWIECGEGTEIGYAYTDNGFSAPDQSVSMGALLSYAASRRYRAETGGCVWNGWVQATDDRGQAKCMAELQAINEGLRADGDGWKFAHGFEALTNTEMRDLVVAVRAHVAACYEGEGIIRAEIEAGTLTTLDDVENWPNWPGVAA